MTGKKGFVDRLVNRGDRLQPNDRWPTKGVIQSVTNSVERRPRIPSGSAQSPSLETNPDLTAGVAKERDTRGVSGNPRNGADFAQLHPHWAQNGDIEGSAQSGPFALLELRHDSHRF